jgi:D-serine deaminase-like pyridoxal phosphate-dependent protein
MGPALEPVADYLLAAALEEYRVAGLERVLTPALAIFPAYVDQNIAATLRLLGGVASRWRPHVKTAKLAWTMRRYVEHGVTQFKCATTLELATVCAAGAQDVLFAFPAFGATARRVQELALEYSPARISALVEHASQIDAWRSGSVGLFIDVNPGMNRTGADQTGTAEIVALARAITSAGITFCGLHYYDGHLGGLALPERITVAHQGYDQLMRIVAALQSAGIAVPEVVTAGTPAFPCALAYAPFRDAPFIHRSSPGTIVYNDTTSLSQLPQEYGYRPAALVIATVVSHPTRRRVTCDAGHKSVSADAGMPTCAVLGYPHAQPARPSEEHLPIDLSEGTPLPALGSPLYLIPRHICPTVNNFDHALLIEHGQIVRSEPVTARGHENLLW